MAVKGTPRWEIYNKKTNEFLTVVTGANETQINQFCEEMYPNTQIELVFTKSRGIK